MSQGRQAKAASGVRLERAQPHRGQGDAARKRAAVEMIAEHETALKRTARRFSLDSEDAEDAYQRALEIVLTKAPTTDLRELIRWTQTVTKHEALAVRQGRERLLGKRRGPDREEMAEPIALLPAAGDGPEEQVERREAIARSREALRALKPAERRALSLLAEGYSYAEICTLTGFSATKVNRVLAEGRDRFRRVIAGSEDGTRCRELGPLLSAFCDGEAADADAALVREHLRACARCRSTARAYRAAPRIVAGLAPLLPPARSLLGRLQDLLAGLGSRLPGSGGGEAAATQLAAAGGSSGAGIATLAKLLAVCAGVAGGGAACATGALPGPQALALD
ncbi:MAG: sigma-70 family RNA polymerase sigma factor, partial [Solirubrobacterales bacterium]